MVKVNVADSNAGHFDPTDRVPKVAASTLSNLRACVPDIDILSFPQPHALPSPPTMTTAARLSRDNPPDSHPAWSLCRFAGGRPACIGGAAWIPPRASSAMGSPRCGARHRLHMQDDTI